MKTVNALMSATLLSGAAAAGIMHFESELSHKVTSEIQECYGRVDDRDCIRGVNDEYRVEQAAANGARAASLIVFVGMCGVTFLEIRRTWPG
jgi:hypothetical protein